jgi:hypothetical protein
MSNPSSAAPVPTNPTSSTAVDLALSPFAMMPMAMTPDMFPPNIIPLDTLLANAANDCLMSHPPSAYDAGGISAPP